MSTKIYDGFKFRTMDLMKIHRCIMKFRKELEVRVEQKVADLVARRVEQILDELALGYRNLSGNESTPYIEAWTTIQDDLEQVRRTHERNPEVDFSFELSILPLNNKILGVSYTECQDFMDL